MLPLILFGVIVGAPILLGLVMRVNAIYVFMSICAGYLLQTSLSGSVDLMMATFVRGSNSLQIAKIALFALPVVLTLLFLRKTVGRGWIFQFIPLILSGAMFGILMLPLLSPGFVSSVYSAQYGSNIRQAGDLITSVAIGANLLAAFLVLRHPSSHGSHNKHH